MLLPKFPAHFHNQPVRTLVLFVLLFVFSFSGYAQKHMLDIKNLDLSDYPTVRGDIWSRDPNGLDTSRIKAFEEGKALKLSYKGKKDSTLSKKNKAILFLVLNPGTSFIAARELDWYKKVLKGAISSNTIKKGDQVDILDFNHQQSGQILYPSSLSMTDNIDVIHERINNLKPRSSRSSSCSQVLLAIDEALNLMVRKNLDMPAGIVVLSDDVVCKNNLMEDLASKSRRLNIPVYAITFSALRSPFNSIDNKVCIKTFGEYFKDKAPGGSEVASVEKLTGYLNTFLGRHKGVLYKYQWKTDLPKDGKVHTIALKYEDVTTDYTYTPPRKNILEWVIANPLLAGGLFLLLGALGFGAYYYVNRQKLLQQRQKEQLEGLQRDQEAKAAQHAQQLQQQQREVEQIKERERREKQQLEDQKRAERKANEEKELIRQMKLRGILPSLDCMAEGASFVYTLAKPETTIGRTGDCDLVLNYPTVSKKHCKLNFINNEYLLEDLGSSNGTTVNNRRITRVVLKHGDVIRLGEVVINFRM